jgi:Tfp pilus assembly protein PilO
MSSRDSSVSNIRAKDRLLNLVMAFLFLSCLVGCYFLRQAIASDFQRIEQDTLECCELANREGECRETLQAEVHRNEELQVRLQKLLNKFPKRVDDSDVLSSFSAVCLESKISLNRFQPANTVDNGEYKTRSFSLQLEGDFNGLFRFFESLENFSYAHQVSTAKILEPNQTGGTCRLDLDLIIVFDHVWNTQASVSK